MKLKKYLLWGLLSVSFFIFLPGKLVEADTRMDLGLSGETSVISENQFSDHAKGEEEDQNLQIKETGDISIPAWAEAVKEQCLNQKQEPYDDTGLEESVEREQTERGSAWSEGEAEREAEGEAEGEEKEKTSDCYALDGADADTPAGVDEKKQEELPFPEAASVEESDREAERLALSGLTGDSVHMQESSLREWDDKLSLLIEEGVYVIGAWEREVMKRV